MHRDLSFSKWLRCQLRQQERTRASCHHLYRPVGNKVAVEPAGFGLQHESHVHVHQQNRKQCRPTVLMTCCKARLAVHVSAPAAAASALVGVCIALSNSTNDMCIAHIRAAIANADEIFLSVFQGNSGAETPTQTREGRICSSLVCSVLFLLPKNTCDYTGPSG